LIEAVAAEGERIGRDEYAHLAVLRVSRPENLASEFPIRLSQPGVRSLLTNVGRSRWRQSRGADALNRRDHLIPRRF